MFYSRIYVDPKDLIRVYVMGLNRGVFISDDSARNFREVHGEDHILYSPNHMVVAEYPFLSTVVQRGCSASTFRSG